MIYALTLGLLFGGLAHADLNCREQAQLSAEKFVQGYLPTLRPRLLQDIKVAYAADGVNLKDEQIEFQQAPFASDLADVVVVVWDWPRVIVHLTDHDDTLFAPLANSPRMTVNIGVDGDACTFSGRMGGGFLQVHYYNLENFTPVFADTILDTPVWNVRVDESSRTY